MDDEQNTLAALQAVLARFIQEASLPDSVAFNFMRWYAGVTESRSRHAYTQFPAALSSRNALGACGDDRIV